MGVCCAAKRKKIEGFKISEFKAFVDEEEKELRDNYEKNENQGKIYCLLEYDNAEDIRIMYCYSASLKFLYNVSDILEKNKGFLEKNNDLKSQIRLILQKFLDSNENWFLPENVRIFKLDI
jgi:hypothetical protein